MSESPYIHNVGMNNFQQLVLEKSINKPVLVDFWADWCQPCQTIMPMLAKLADEYDGQFELARCRIGRIQGAQQRAATRFDARITGPGADAAILEVECGHSVSADRGEQ